MTGSAGANEALAQVEALRGKRVFVSGGAGVIGRELVELLYSAGAQILVGDLAKRPAGWSAEIGYRRGDLNHVSHRELEAFAPEFFFHLAATFERSTETPGFFSEGYTHNVALSHHLIDCLSRTGTLRRVVFASSYLIYDPSLYSTSEPCDEAALLSETSPIRPRNLCGSAKHHHELELDFLSNCPGAKFTSISARIFRSYGRGSRDVISRWVRSLFAGESLDVYQPEGCFDYVFARDVALGLLALAASEATGSVNLGTAAPRRVSEVLEVLSHHFPQMRTTTRSPEDAPLFEGACADTTKLRAATRWSPTTSLEHGIAAVVAHERALLRPDTAVRSAAKATSGPSIQGHDVLIMSISKKIPLIRSVRRAIAKFDGEARVHGADSDAEALGLHFVDVFWNCPPLGQLSFEILFEHCRTHGIRYIVPTRDAELSVFANFKSKLAREGIDVLVSSPSSVAHCVDKLRFAQLLEAAGLPVIETSESLDLLPRPARVVVKDRYGSGSKDLCCDVPPADARSFADRLVSPIFQPFEEGREFSVDLYRNRSGEVHGAICRTRDSVVGGESQITTLVNSPELCALCENVVRVLDFWGHATLQAIEVGSGEFKILECNARFGGASTLSDQVGLESFYWFLLEASGEDLSAFPFRGASSGLKLIRHAADHFVSTAGSSTGPAVL